MGQGCNEPFISEYVEGWSNNKAIEIYNPTNATIDLSAYRLERYSNGSTSAADNQKLDLVGTVAPGQAYVIVIDKQNPDGTGQEAPVWDELAEVADIFMCPVYDENNAMYFNGNDALVLRKIDGNLVVDVFGRIGEDPGDPSSDGGGWNNVGPDFTVISNGEIAWTKDHTLLRKFEVTAGDLAPTDAFDVSVQWDSLPANTFDNLGIHNCTCQPLSINEQELAELDIFPNPTLDGQVTLMGMSNATEVRVYGMDGKAVLRQEVMNEAVLKLDLTPFGRGVFLVQVTGAQGSTVTRRILNR